MTQDDTKAVQRVTGEWTLQQGALMKLLACNAVSKCALTL